MAAANARPWRTLAIAVAALAMCVSVLLTTGRSAATEQRVLGEVDRGGARLITMTWRDAEGGIDPAAVERIGSIAQVEWVYGLSAALDMRNLGIPGGGACPAKFVIGDLPAGYARMTVGRPASPGEGLTTASASRCLGLAYPSGSIATTARHEQGLSFGIVGELEVSGLLEGLTGYAILAAREAPSAASITALARSTRDVPSVARAMAELSGANSRLSLTVETSAALAELDVVLQRELADSSRVIGLTVLLGGMAFAGLALMLSVGSQRRDFGRRRALGASRSMLIVLVLLEATIPAIIGATVGTVLGTCIVLLTSGETPGPQFVLSVPVLTVLAVVVGALPAALTAAIRDPVAILRVP